MYEYFHLSSAARIGLEVLYTSRVRRLAFSDAWTSINTNANLALHCRPALPTVRKNNTLEVVTLVHRHVAAVVPLYYRILQNAIHIYVVFQYTNIITTDAVQVTFYSL
jgi:hypothetical protein